MAFTKYVSLKERALLNFEHLLHFWNITYTKIGADEYDFLNPTREDKSFGACRFNTTKGIGADFAGSAFTESDFKFFGKGFSKEDFVGFAKDTRNANWGFDIIGMCQRIHNLRGYKEAAAKLQGDLKEIKKRGIKLLEATKEAILERERKIQEDKNKKLKIAELAWNTCKPIKGTIGEKYLNSRGIYIKEEEKSLKFHPKVYNSELKKEVPVILLKVTKEPNGLLTAVHRIYIKSDGSNKRDDISENKTALGAVKGCGVWFGTPKEKLYVVEGPENALTYRCIGFEFVVCTIYGTNFHDLTIPEYVETVVLCPDEDKPNKNKTGKEFVIKAINEYQKQNKKVKVVYTNKLF